MSTKNSQHPGHNIQLPNSPMKVSTEYLKPSDLVHKHSTKRPAFESFKFLFNHVLDFVATNRFNKWQQAYRKQALKEFEEFGEMVYDLEKHAQDHNVSYCIINYLRCVQKLPEDQITIERKLLDQLKEKYGSVTNAIQNLAAVHETSI